MVAWLIVAYLIARVASAHAGEVAPAGTQEFQQMFPVVQAALAAGLSWFVAMHLFGHRAPLFAPVTAIVCIAI